MNAWKTVKLGDLTDILSGFAFPSEGFGDSGNLPLVRIRDVVPGESNTWFSGDFDSTYLIDTGDILVGMDGEFNRAKWKSGRALLNQRVCRVQSSSDLLDDGFLFWLLPRILKVIEDATPFVTVKHLSVKQLRNVEFPLPPLPEQRRIAAILDQADFLRAKRRAALAKLDSLAQSIFVEMFGDPVTNSKQWPAVPLREMLRFPLRNGLSPSDAGTVAGRVLTLSAITRGAFDPGALKEAKFHVSPPQDQVVDVEDLLICRGNGNPDLVGRGHFPTESMTDVLFPDTMIAARVDTDRWPKRFVEFAWNGVGVRQQIGKLVRTTNGTYKVNQGMLEGVLLLAPPKPLQIQFANYLDAAAKHREVLRISMTHLDALFASLQHRAFRGEL